MYKNASLSPCKYANFIYFFVVHFRSVIMSDEKNCTAGGEPEIELVKLAIAENKPSDSNDSAAGSISPSAGGGNGDFKESFKAFSKFGDIKSDGKLITLSQSDKWMKQAKVIDKKITTTDTAIHFKKLKSLKISFVDYNKFLEDLTQTKKVELADIKKKLSNCGAPGVHQVSSVRDSEAKGDLFNSNFFYLKAGKASAAVNRLTDTSKYTGSSKQRFDETGKGKGIAGRKNQADQSGYVSGYQHKDTYDNVH